MKINTQLFNKVYDYVPVDFEGLPNAPVFMLKTLSAKQLAQLDDNLTKVNRDDTITIASASHTLNTLKVSLRGWANLFDENDSQLAFKLESGAASDESLEIIPSYIRQELANFILTKSRFPDDGAEELKKP